jgi:hypothetical protein
MPGGGYRPGAGRPRKNPIEKKLEGKGTDNLSRSSMNWQKNPARLSFKPCGTVIHECPLLTCSYPAFVSEF